LQAAAGTASVADATIATTEADLATQLASGVTSKAVTALNSIMNMPM
jgi:flagellar hook-basal body complex protein FliE